jgi:hypothetical protein
MKNFVKFAKLTASGAVVRPGWRLRLFATANEASAFAREMIAKGWRAELGTVGDVESDAPRLPLVKWPSRVVAAWYA